MQQGEMLYEGKAKQVFLTDDPDMILIHYKDAATAFNNIKKATIENKGVLNNRISTLIFEYLNKQGIKTHYVKTLNDRDQLCRRVRIIPLEVIVRNVIAGSMAQRLGIEEGTKPSNVIFDICYKNDELGDPLINDHHAVALGVVTYDELKQIYAMTARINEVLKELFAKMNINLIDFKIEFGRTSDGRSVLADEVSPDEEWRRVRLGLAAVRQADPDVAVSVDTFRAEVARRVLETFGPVIVNDISAGEMDPAIVDVVAEYDAPYIAMHMRGTPATMQGMTSYRDVVEEVVSYFRLRAEQLRRCGVRRLILDPGFGFAKTLEQNYDLLRGLHNLCSLGYPVLAGVSRKSMIYKVLDTTPDRALAGTIALGWECLRQGAAILRVHDVREAVDTVRIFKAFRP